MVKPPDAADRRRLEALEAEWLSTTIRFTDAIHLAHAPGAKEGQHFVSDKAGTACRAMLLPRIMPVPRARATGEASERSPAPR
jgi:hypothetical protein